METNVNSKSLKEVLRLRRSVRSFALKEIPAEDIKEIVEAALLAPYAAATGIAPNEIRKVFVFRQNTEAMTKARELIHSQIKGNAKKMNMMLRFLPFLREKMQSFANKLNSISSTGIPSLTEASHYLVVAAKKGFPPMEKQSLAHALQNMWLRAADLGYGFQLMSATGMMAKNAEFMKLLGLSVGEYEIDGCVIGVLKAKPEPKKEIPYDECVRWL